VPLLAVRLTQQPVLVSAVSAAAFLPWLLFSLPIGALVDRYDRIRLMWCSQLVQSAVVVITTILIAGHLVHIAVLMTMAFVLGSCEVLFANAAQVTLPELVPASLLHRANGYLSSAGTIGQSFIGPPLGSLLFTVAVALPFGVNAASFVLSALLVLSVPHAVEARAEHPPIGRSIKDGMSWLLAHRALRTLALLLGANTFCFAMGNATLVLLATRTLHLSAHGFGFLLAAAAIGSVLGGVVNARLLARIGDFRGLVLSLVSNAVLFVAIGLAPNAFVLGVLLAASGFVTTIWSILTVTLRQQLVPAELRGRVNSVYRMLGWGPIPLGALAGGVVAATVGLRAPYLVAGGLRAIAFVIALRGIAKITKR
jgi:MFS family permease